jgi:hypothetical protein
MIKAEHNKLARLVFIPYMNRMLKKNFSAFYLANEIPKIPKNTGLVITPNHISWWDGFFAEYLFSRTVNRRLHIMMLEEQLKRFWFFKHLGAYSIDPQKTKSIIETSNYTCELVNNTENFSIMYPQGEIEPFEKRPLTIKKGIRFLIKDVQREFYVLPVGFKIEYYDEKYPAVVARFGNLLNGKIIKEDFETYVKEFYSNLDLLAQASYSKTFNKNLFKK